MPVVPNSEDNFIHGLSDFWPAFFRDTRRLSGVYEAQQIQYGQLYLDLLDTVLGVSLAHAPLFSKKYFRDFYIRENELTFVEGASPADDRYLFVPPDQIAAAPSLMNRVLAPTQVAEYKRDYDLQDGAFLFRRDPFDTAAFVAFPQRSLDVAFAACLNGTWTGVRTGDTFRLRVGNGSPRYARIAGVRGTTLLLDTTVPEFNAAAVTAVATAKLTTLRVPYNANQSGVVPAVQPTEVHEHTATPVDGTATLSIAGASGGWVGSFIVVKDDAVPANSGFHRVNSTGAGVVHVDRSGVFQASSAQTVYRVKLSEAVSWPAYTQLPHTYLRPGTLTLYGRRYEDGEALTEGVDYTVDYDAGRIYFLSAWDPQSQANARYTWDLKITEDVVSGAIPFRFDQVFETREMVAWAPDALVDRDVLYRNFGYLFGFRRNTSETYRAFLQGVARLYLLGATAARFEAALNVMVGFSLARGNETLQSYDSGIVVDQTVAGQGTVTDTNDGRDGVFDNGTSQFRSPTANFFPDDVGAPIHHRTATGVEQYVVTAVISPTVVTVTPTPADATDVVWSYAHVLVSRRFSISTTAFAFSSDDLESTLEMFDHRNSANQGKFRVIAVENPSSVIVASQFPLVDATITRWRLTRTGEQRVVTDKNEYVFPFDVPLREDIADPASIGTLTFAPFEALTDAFEVLSEQIDPVWWHNVAIPPSILELDNESAARRYVSSALVEHRFGAPDGAVFGDVDLFFGLDEEGRPGIKREGTLIWGGGPWVQLSVDLDVRQTDLGQYLRITSPRFSGHFEIERLATDGVTVKLKRFPPPEAQDVGAPVLLEGALPDLLFRRTASFVMFDRFLKRHALAVRIDRNVHLPSSVLSEVATLIQESKPTHSHVYLETQNDYTDGVSLGELFSVTIRPQLVDDIPAPDNRLVYGPDSIVEFGDAFIYVDETFTMVYGGGAFVWTLPTTPPYGGPYRYVFVNARFTTGTSMGRDLAEGVDYVFDKASGKVAFIQGDAGAVVLQTTACYLRTRTLADALLPYETRLAFSGMDPTKGTGLVDRPVSIRIT